MKLRRLVCGDIHFQWKYGFYFIYFVKGTGLAVGSKKTEILTTEAEKDKM